MELRSKNLTRIQIVQCMYIIMILSYFNSIEIQIDYVLLAKLFFLSVDVRAAQSHTNERREQQKTQLFLSKSIGLFHM